MSIVDILYPRLCVGCGREGKYICGQCAAKLTVPPAICPECCKPSRDGWVHPRCKTKYGMDRLIVGLPYRGVVQQALKQVKYKNAWDAIQAICEICQEKFTIINLHFSSDKEWLITSVPMYRQKERERGFNQAEVLANQLAQFYKEPTLVLLERMRETRPMYGLRRKERQNNVLDAFRLSEKLKVNSVKSMKVILVDDVWTTGATMRECAKVLTRAGAKEVWGITLAR